MIKGLVGVIIPIAVLITGVCLLPTDGAADNIFRRPQTELQILDLLQQLRQTAATHDTPATLRIAARITELRPADPAALTAVAAAQATAGDPNAALNSLNAAVTNGLRDPEELASGTAFSEVRRLPAWQDLIRRMSEAPPSVDPVTAIVPEEIVDGVALVTPANTRWDASRRVLLSTFHPASVQPDALVVRDTGPAAELLLQWQKEGTAAGLSSVLYDNRDRDHSALDVSRFPQLTRVEFGPEAQEVRFDWGLQIHHLLDRPTFGNSSTSNVSRVWWRSNPRALQHSEMLTQLAYNQYISNHIYLYPEHRDFDPEHGDVFPANTPFYLASQGSSGSDRPFMKAVALTLAAFRPEVRSKLESSGLLMPTVQYVFRRCLSPVHSDEDYLSAVAHPAVFQGDQIEPERLVRLAHQMTVDQVPPMIQLHVAFEDTAQPGRDYFVMAGEKLFDTPVAIARIHRRSARDMKLVVDASRSRDLNFRPLTFRWVVLQGDAENVQIEPVNSAGTQARITFRWQPPSPVRSQPELLCSRVDIGVFASNGQYWSAPGFICSCMLANESREYLPDGRIHAIDYNAPGIRDRYLDPLLDGRRNWKDEYAYSPEGLLVGWTRTADRQAARHYSRDGLLIETHDALGRPDTARAVNYVTESKDGAAPVINEVLTPQRFRYRYASDADRIGVARPLSAAGN